TVVDDLRGGPGRGGDHGGSPGQRFDHDHAEGFGPGDGVEEADGVGQQAVLVVTAELAEVFDVAAEPGADGGVEVGLFGGLAHLGGDPQRHPGPPCDPDGPVDAFVGRHPAQESGVPTRPGTALHAGEVDAVVDDGVDGDLPGGRGLVVGDGDDRQMGTD